MPTVGAATPAAHRDAHGSPRRGTPAPDGAAPAGLVHARRDGRLVYYRVRPSGMKPLIDWIAHYRAFWTERVDRLERLLEKMDE